MSADTHAWAALFVILHLNLTNNSINNYNNINNNNNDI